MSSSMPPDPPGIESEARKRSVLIIEDVRELRAMTAAMLQAVNLETFEAEDGVVGLALYRRHKPDLVITDISMPNKDGIETIRAIKAIDPEVPIIAVSGGGRTKYPDPLRLARNLGAVATLEKPFLRTQLLAAVALALEPGPALG